MNGEQSKVARGKIARMRLIDLYAQNLALYNTFQRRTIVCPLCPRGMEFDDPADIEMHWSRAHIYPQALGGNRVTLACPDCNSRVGRKYEAALKRESEDAQWSKGELSRRARMTIAGQSLAVDFRKKGSGYELAIVAGLHAPGASEIARQHLASGEGALFDLSIKSPNPERVALSLLHSAFLSAFSTFGYEYALCPSANRVREALTQSTFNGTVFTKAIVGIPASESSNGYPGKQEFSLVRDDRGFRGFLFSVTDKDSYHRFVILPGFEDADWAAYQEFLSPQQSSFKMTLRVYKVPPADFLADVASRFWGHKLLQSWHCEDAAAGS
jgi:hypothetical protein